jgi:excinuclease ABC subunit A
MPVERRTPGKIVIRGARVHNLKNIDLEIPRDQFVIVTGVSGSGKSSLAFDTLYAEGQRRYIESLSTDTRQLLHQLERPDADSIDGLSPTVAIEPKAANFGPRSTVGTVTEIADFLRLLFARVGQPHCPRCGTEISRQSIDGMIDQLTSLGPGTRIFVLAPLATAKGSDPNKILRELVRQGFSRIKIADRIHDISEELKLKVDSSSRIHLLVDRLVIREGIESRLADSLEVAARVGKGVIKIEVHPEITGAPMRELTFSQRLACIGCGSGFPEMTPGLFSFNSAHGACPVCGGLGIQKKAARKSEPIGEVADARPCAGCHGARLGKESLAVSVGGKNIAEVASLPITEVIPFLEQLQLRERERPIGAKLLTDIMDRLGFLVRAGLEYLSLERRCATLSGGEVQRVRLAKQLGSRLAGVLYLLDEPSIGLHQKDNARLLGLLKELRNGGNSVIVVEHDPDTILSADYVIDMGPGAGVNGGQVVAQGTPADLIRHPESLTGQYLSGRRRIFVPQQRRRGTGKFLIVRGARRNNLQNVTVEIPIGVMTCVSGVSGSGKSTLIMEILAHGVSQRLRHARLRAGQFDAITGWQHFDRVIEMDQSPIGRTPASNPATYTGIYDPIRELFAQLPEARVRGYRSNRFSFNTSGGRCEACAGAGVVKIDMAFLPDVLVTCESCQGRRYNRETLEIRYKGLNVADVLELTVSQALEVLTAFPIVSVKLRSLIEVGLGYLRLGQTAQSLSGGEAQRVKLAKELGRRSTGRSLYVLDEPTSGLHCADVEKLLHLLHRLTDAGNTIVIIEHNLDVIKSADYVIDLGPEGGPKGGRVIATGSPEAIAATRDSFTGQYLKKWLSQDGLPYAGGARQ